MKKLLIFGGTSEEHGLLKALEPFQLEIILCVASAYGKTLTPTEYPGLTVHAGRLTSADMAEFMRKKNFFAVIDATHPYAVEATKNIKAAARQADIPYFRLLRQESKLTNATVVTSVTEAVNKLNGTSNNVLLTTGSKDLAAFTNVIGYKDRVYPRVLPTPESVSACLENGYPAKHIIAMQGPFSKELNIALMRQFAIKTLVTKDGGKEGGFPEKLEAAAALNADVIVIRRPEEDGLTLDAVISEISIILEEAQ